eukprot:GCRY01004903.1.p1 GENE.GCRY01004903.1~~GCRY01004903.1.p1  ORF type:complete len:439 (-),score=69.58 GCRY01004903.1:77-1393(-)
MEDDSKVSGGVLDSGSDLDRLFSGDESEVQTNTNNSPSGEESPLKKKKRTRRHSEKSNRRSSNLTVQELEALDSDGEVLDAVLDSKPVSPKKAKRRARSKSSFARSSQQKRPKKVKSHKEESSEESNAEGPETVGEIGVDGAGTSEFDQALETIKAQKSRASLEINHQKLINDARVLLYDMETAAKEDFAAIKNKEVAAHKLKVLPRFTKAVLVREMQDALVDCGLLSVLFQWLRPLPDRSLPNYNIRHSLLNIILKLQVTADQLEGSKIGAAIAHLRKRPEETYENKEIANNILNNWGRLIYGLSDDYKELSEFEYSKTTPKMKEMEDFREKFFTKKCDEEQLEQGQTMRRRLQPGEKGFSWHARIPLPTPTDFYRRPVGQLEVDDFSTPLPRAAGSRVVPAQEVQKSILNRLRKKPGKSGDTTAVKVNLDGKGFYS